MAPILRVYDYLLAAEVSANGLGLSLCKMTKANGSDVLFNSNELNLLNGEVWRRIGCSQVHVSTTLPYLV